MRTALLFCIVAGAGSALHAGTAHAEIHRNPGSTTPQPHQKYVHVVSDADSPVQRTYIKSKDGLYIAAAIRKPKGDRTFPAMIVFHGAPGGRSMERTGTTTSASARKARSVPTCPRVKSCSIRRSTRWKNPCSLPPASCVRVTKCAGETTS